MAAKTATKARSKRATQTIEPGRFYRYQEVNDALAVGSRWCQLKVESGDLAAIKVDGLTFILGSDLIAYLTAHRTTAK
jgi:hypothetical protein